jgi:hypothetical protein
LDNIAENNENLIDDGVPGVQGNQIRKMLKAPRRGEFWMVLLNNGVR